MRRFCECRWQGVPSASDGRFMRRGVVAGGQRRFLVVCVAVDAKRPHVVVVSTRRRLPDRAAASFISYGPTLPTSASFFGSVLHVLAEKTYSADSSQLTQCRKPIITLSLFFYREVFRLAPFFTSTNLYSLETSCCHYYGIESAAFPFYYKCNKKFPFR